MKALSGFVKSSCGTGSTLVVRFGLDDALFVFWERPTCTSSASPSNTVPFWSVRVMCAFIRSPRLCTVRLNTVYLPVSRVELKLLSVHVHLLAALFESGKRTC